MKVVSNSSPIIFLSSIEKLDLFKSEFGSILIPEAVYKEITTKNLSGSNEVQRSEWIKVMTVKNPDLISLLPLLDIGEKEAIILAIEQAADLLLLDDLAGRRAAMMYGINIMGTLGFLKVMHRKHRISNLKDVLNNLQETGFWMSDDLYNKILED